MYNLIKVDNCVRETIGKYDTFEEAKQEFNNNVTAFLDGNSEDGYIHEANGIFEFEYEDGTLFWFEIIEE